MKTHCTHSGSSCSQRQRQRGIGRRQPLFGTWKLNVEKSTLAGQTLTYTASATGFEFSNGSTVKFEFAIDGKDYPIIPGRRFSWTKSGDNSWTVSTKMARGR